MNKMQLLLSDSKRREEDLTMLILVTVNVTELFWSQALSKPFMSDNSFNPQQFCEVGTVISLILQIRKQAQKGNWIPPGSPGEQMAEVGFEPKESGCKVYPRHPRHYR